MTVEKAIAHMEHRCGKEQCNLLAEDQQAMRVAIDALRQLLDETEWRPIKTAPKDGKKLLMFWPHASRDAVIGWWDNETEWTTTTLRSGYGHHRNVLNRPTHWIPLPAPPKEGSCK